MKCCQGRLAGLGRGRWQHPCPGTLGRPAQQLTWPIASGWQRFDWSERTLLHRNLPTFGIWLPCNPPCLPLQHPWQDRNVHSLFFYPEKLPSGSWGPHSQTLFRAYTNGPQTPESICQGWELNPGSQSTNHCWNQGSSFHLEQTAWVSWHGASMGSRMTRLWPLLGITFPYLFSLRCLSCRTWYSACSQKTSPTSLFCIMNLKRTKSLTKLRYFYFHVCFSTIRSWKPKALPLKATNCDRGLPSLQRQPPEQLCDLLLSYTQGLAGSLLADRLQEGCRQLVSTQSCLMPRRWHTKPPSACNSMQTYPAEHVARGCASQTNHGQGPMLAHSMLSP